MGNQKAMTLTKTSVLSRKDTVGMLARLKRIQVRYERATGNRRQMLITDA